MSEAGPYQIKNNCGSLLEIQEDENTKKRIFNGDPWIDINNKKRKKDSS